MDDWSIDKNININHNTKKIIRFYVTQNSEIKFNVCGIFMGI